MKRWLFISGIVIIVILTTIWVYLLFVGPPAGGGGLFSAFDFGDTTEEGVDIPPPAPENILVDSNGPEQLRQLTLKKVIGHSEIATTSSSTPTIYFAEAGTGYIYAIDIASGIEKRVSNVTVPKADKAAISKDGTHAAIATGNTLTLITLPTVGDEATSTIFPENVTDFSLSDTGELLYTTVSGGGVTGKAYTVSTKTTKTLFALPFREVVMVWGKTAADTHFAYPKTSIRLEGYLYEIKSGVINRIPASGYGFNALSDTTFSIYSERQNDVYRSYLYTSASKTTAPLAVVLLPEKCVFSQSTSGAICAVSKTAPDSSFPDMWYKGDVIYSDDVWLVDFTSLDANVVIDLETLSGRQLDAVELSIAGDDERLYFINKADQSLWLFDSTVE